MKATAYAIVIGSLICAAVPILTLQQVFAQQQSSQGPAMNQSGNKIDVRLEPIQSGDKSYSFKVTFLQPKTQNVQVHIDYDVSIMQNGKVLYDAAKSTGQTLLHTAEGQVTIPDKPYIFADSGNYTVRVQVFGIVFNPITPETFDFTTAVSPEFPEGIMIASAGIVAFALIVSRKLKHN